MRTSNEALHQSHELFGSLMEKLGEITSENVYLQEVKQWRKKEKRHIELTADS